MNAAYLRTSHIMRVLFRINFHNEIHSILNNRKKLFLIAAWSYLFSLSWTLPQNLKGHSLLWCAIIAFAIGVLIFNVLILFLASYMAFGGGLKIYRNRIFNHSRFKLSFCTCFIALVLMYGVYFLVLFPGCCSTDSNDIFKMVWGLPFESNHFRYSTINNHHPASYVFLNYVLTCIGSLLQLDRTGCVGLIAFFHLIVLASSCAFVIAELRKLSHSNRFTVVVFLFFLFNPVMGRYSITIWKDIIFSGAFVVFTVLFIELILAPQGFMRQRRNIVIFVISALSCMLFRSNGIITVTAVLLLAIPFVKPIARKLSTLLAVLLISITLFITGPVYHLTGVQSAHFSTILSVPLQQVGRVFVEKGNMDVNDRNLFDDILPANQWDALYNPITPVPIEYNAKFNDFILEKNKMFFLTAWIRTGFKNPGTYLRAWIAETQAYWNPKTPASLYSCGAGYNVGNGLEAKNLLQGLFKKSAFDTLFNVAYHVASPIYHMGSLVWFMLFVLLTLVIRGDKKTVLCLLPLLMLWLILLPSAPASDFRYMFALHLALPILCFLFLFKIEPEMRRVRVHMDPSHKK